VTKTWTRCEDTAVADRGLGSYLMLQVDIDAENVESNMTAKQRCCRAQLLTGKSRFLRALETKLSPSFVDFLKPTPAKVPDTSCQITYTLSRDKAIAADCEIATVLLKLTVLPSRITGFPVKDFVIS
jgi:hypothetical protein